AFIRLNFLLLLLHEALADPAAPALNLLAIQIRSPVQVDRSSRVVKAAVHRRFPRHPFCRLGAQVRLGRQMPVSLLRGKKSGRMPGIGRSGDSARSPRAASAPPPHLFASPGKHGSKSRTDSDPLPPPAHPLPARHVLPANLPPVSGRVRPPDPPIHG